MKNGQFEAHGVTLKQLLQVAFRIPSSRIVGPGWINEEEWDVSSGPNSSLKHALEEAFKLQTHMDKRPMTVYVLTGKLGAVPAAAPHVRDGEAHITGKAITMKTLTSKISETLHAPVVDETGLTGHFDVDVAYDPNGPGELIDQMRRLGLNLTRTTRETDVLVVDHAERPR